MAVAKVARCFAHFGAGGTKTATDRVHSCPHCIFVYVEPVNRDTRPLSFDELRYRAGSSGHHHRQSRRQVFGKLGRLTERIEPTRSAQEQSGIGGSEVCSNLTLGNASDYNAIVVDLCLVQALAHFRHMAR